MKRAELLASLDIGACIKRLREKKGLSQDELAKGICDRTNITKLENGYSKIPSLTFVLLLCDKLGITIEEFLNEALSNTYSINKSYVIDALLEADYQSLNEYLKEIDFDSLINKDKNLYNYCRGKILISENKIDEAKEYLLPIINNKNSISVTTLLSYSEAIKTNIIKKNNSNYPNNILKFLDSMDDNSPGYFYIVNDLIESYIKDNNLELANNLLEREISYINKTSSFKYLKYYYTNKMNINKNDIEIVKDCKNKLSAINTLNKSR